MPLVQQPTLSALSLRFSPFKQEDSVRSPELGSRSPRFRFRTRNSNWWLYTSLNRKMAAAVVETERLWQTHFSRVLTELSVPDLAATLVTKSVAEKYRYVAP